MATVSVQGQGQGLNHEQEATLDMMIQKAESQLTDEVIEKARELAAQNMQGFKKGGRGGGDVKAAFPFGGIISAVGVTAFKQVTVLGGTLYNKSKSAKTLFQENKWEGYFLPKYPSRFDGFGAFVHYGVTICGVKAAVVYAGHNDSGFECAWLVAWTDSNDGTKLYAECGPKSKYYYVDWSEINRKLEKGGSVVYESDKKLGISVYAKIVGGCGKHGLGIVFSG